jgi:hypothetical protein
MTIKLTEAAEEVAGEAEVVEVAGAAEVVEVTKREVELATLEVVAGAEEATGAGAL